jgi:predicted dehydrogenase
MQEAFMVRTHPQWIATRDLIREGASDLSGPCWMLQLLQRRCRQHSERAGFGGGGLMDIGCYLINTSRFIFDRPPIA